MVGSSNKPQLQSYDLGQGKHVQLYVPHDSLNQQLKQQQQQEEESKISNDDGIDLTQYYGTGDAIWPS